MLSVVLWVLKLMGSILLAILGLLLLIVLLVLFGAIRYRGEGSFLEKRFKGSVRISWLFPVFAFQGSWQEDGFHGAIRILGIRIWNSEAPKPEAERPEEEEAEDEGTALEGGEETEEEPLLHVQEAVSPLEEKSEETDSPSGERQETEKTNEWETAKAKTADGKKKKRKLSLEAIFQKIRFSFQRICDKLRTAKENWNRVKGWIEEEENQKSVKLVISQIKKGVKHIAPRKGQGNITFGLEDPYMTGVILKYAALFYPLYGEYLEVTPVFDRNILEGSGWLRGRVRIGILAGCILRLLWDRNIRKIVRAWLGR